MAAWTRNRERTTSVRLMSGPLHTESVPLRRLKAKVRATLFHTSPPLSSSSTSNNVAFIPPKHDIPQLLTAHPVLTKPLNIAPQNSLVKDDSTTQFNFLSEF